MHDMKTGIAPSRLREVFIYDPELGTLRDSPSAKWRRKKASRKSLTVEVDGVRMLVSRVVWAMHYGEWPDKYVDHKNRDRSDNRIANLRLATHQQNLANCGVRKHNKLGVKGVSLERGKYRAKISVNGRSINLGLFSTLQDAHSCYVSRARKEFGEFANAG